MNDLKSENESLATEITRLRAELAEEKRKVEGWKSIYAKIREYAAAQQADAATDGETDAYCITEQWLEEALTALTAPTEKGDGE